MRKQYWYRPGKLPSALGFIVGLLFCILGIFVVIPGAGLFGVFWTLVSAVITVSHGINLFSQKGLPMGHVIVNEEELEELHGQGGQEKGTVEERLEQLNRLYDQRLITKEEFDAKKAEILESL
ncbi:MAG: SHOCT domain-containing protein [Lachnospiraceae bacterium]|jgi:hypothetical protein|nr:SHOCT domain-containing protein [Lachnospiraceae bacterium]MCI8995833.1 SHOCT domain-containing protein [Lachnospiraceae bacterium]MCI9133786.1 SHOCT domain-containing protein [Lachnospiraceae bacterium]